VCDGLLLCTSEKRLSVTSSERGVKGEGKNQTCRILKAQRRSTVLMTKHLPDVRGLPVSVDAGVTNSTRLKGPEVDRVEREGKSLIEREFEAIRLNVGGSSVSLRVSTGSEEV